MQPYEVEIFDRNFSYKGNALIDEADFEYKEDLVDPEKNTVVIPADVPVAKSDYIRITRWKYRNYLGGGPGEQFYGIVTLCEESEKGQDVTFSQLVTMFDLSVVVHPRDLTQTTVENYIVQVLTAAFVSSSDTSQNIPWLTLATTGSSTTGTFDFCDSGNEYEVISLLDDLIYPAFALYGIKIDFSLRFLSTPVFTATIGKDTNTQKIIEADLPSVFDKTFTIRKQSNREINKATAYEVDSATAYSYYLHPDHTYDTTDSNRIVPVVNSIVTFDSYEQAKKQVDAKYSEWQNEISSYIALERNLTTAELNALTTVVTAMNSVIINEKIWFYNDIETWDGEHEYTKEKTGSQQLADEGFILSGHTKQALCIASTMFGNAIYIPYDDPSVPSQVRYYYSWPQTHVYISEYFIADSTVSGAKWHVTALTPLTASNVRNAIEQYKNTAAYYEEIAAAQAAILQSYPAQFAAKEFSKNQYTNLIELSFFSDNFMYEVEPLLVKPGRSAKIIHDGVEYDTILTGKEYTGGTRIKLIFGMLRLELTRYLKGRY